MDLIYNTVEEILAIPIPKYERSSEISSPHENIEYILQRMALPYRHAGRMDLAIACLRKSNEIFPHSNFSWSADDYLRLVMYLRLDGKPDEAKTELRGLREQFAPKDGERDTNRLLSYSKFTEADLDKAEHIRACCKRHHILMNQNTGGFPDPHAIKSLGILIYTDKLTYDTLIRDYPGFVDDIAESSDALSASQTLEVLIENIRDSEERLAPRVQMQNDYEEYKAMCAALGDLMPKTFQTFHKHKIANNDKYRLWHDEYTSAIAE